MNMLRMFFIHNQMILKNRFTINSKILDFLTIIIEEIWNTLIKREDKNNKDDKTNLEISYNLLE